MLVELDKYIFLRLRQLRPLLSLSRPHKSVAKDNFAHQITVQYHV